MSSSADDLWTSNWQWRAENLITGSKKNIVFGTNDKIERNENKHFPGFHCTVIQL